jgi:uncharacterized membrane protein (UPF0127 family)
MKTNFLCIFILIFITSCFSLSSAKQQSGLENYEIKKVALANGQVISAFLADDEVKQEKGLSGVKVLKDHQGMIFVYPKLMYLRFWMPDTYLNLDIFFLDKNLNVIYIERNVPAHPGRKEPPKIARTANIYAQVVLELRSGTINAKSIKKGDRLKWVAN